MKLVFSSSCCQLNIETGDANSEPTYSKLIDAEKTDSNKTIVDKDDAEKSIAENSNAENPNVENSDAEPPNPTQNTRTVIMIKNTRYTHFF